jgi:hypothetical protein
MIRADVRRRTTVPVTSTCQAGTARLDVSTGSDRVLDHARPEPSEPVATSAVACLGRCHGEEVDWAAAAQGFLALDEEARDHVLEEMAPRSRAAMLSSIDLLTDSR